VERHCRGHQLAVALAVGLIVLASSLYAARARSPDADRDDPGAGSIGLGPIGAVPAIPAELEQGRTIEHSELPLVREASRRLEAYRDAGSCSVECAGYLDMLGNVWGCLIQGEGWAEILVIGGEEDGSSTVQTIRLGVQP